MKKVTNIKEELSEKGEMLGGLQLAWIMIDHVPVSKVQTGMLTFQCLMLVRLKNDNLLAFQND